MTWLSTKQAAELEQVNERTVRRNKEKYQFRLVNGVGGASGVQYEILLESLSESAQARYRGEEEHRQADVLASLTGTQREAVRYRGGVVYDYQQFKEMYPKADKREAFLRQYNELHPDKPVTKRQLNDWETKFNRDGLAGLVDRRGGHNKGESSIPEDVWRVFLAYFMQEKGNSRGGGGPSIALSYRMTQLYFIGRQLPSIAAFQRRIETIPYPALVLGRQGEKAFKDKCEPYIEFDYRSICTNEVWCADNHVFDLWVKDDEGRVFRPWVVGWQDKRSRMIVGYLIIDHDPNADAVLEAFARAVRDHGIPERVLLDNGADYTVHDLFNQDFALSLSNEMGIKVTNANPYNAKAKLIERFFNTFEYSYCITLPSYFGANPQRRPEKMKQAGEALKALAMPNQDFHQFIGTAIEMYNNTVHTGRGMDGKTPCQAFQDFIERPIRVAAPELLAMYFKRTSRLLTIGRNGIRVPDLQLHFDSEELYTHRGEKVYARYDAEDVRQVYCFTEDDEFICVASSTELGTLDQELTAQTMRKLNAQKKQLRKKAREYVPDFAVPSIQRLAIDNELAFQQADLKALPTMQTANSTQQKKAKTVQSAQERLTDERDEQKRPGKDQRKREDAYFKLLTGGTDHAMGE